MSMYDFLGVLFGACMGSIINRLIKDRDVPHTAMAVVALAIFVYMAFYA